MRSTGLIIFDCDGVLVDSETVATKVDQRVLADLGWHLTTEEIVDRFVGGTDEGFKRQIERQLGLSLPIGWDHRYQTWYDDAFAAELTPVVGVIDAIAQIGIPRCLASNGSHERIQRSLTLTGMAELFEGVTFSAEDVGSSKPSPQLFLHAARVMGVKPSGCIVVEDSRFGVQAARAAGMRVLGYSGGLTPHHWLDGKADIVFSDMKDLPGLIRQLSCSEGGDGTD